MRYLIALALVLGGCATGTSGGDGGDDGDDGPSIDANPDIDPPDANPDVGPPDAEPPPPDAMPPADEITAQEFLCNDAFDNDANGQTDCADARCAFTCAALMTACPAPNQLRGYALATLPQTIDDNSTDTVTVAVTQTGAVVLAAVRFSATHTYDGDLDLTLTSPGGTVLDLTSDNGGTNENYTNTVFIDSATTSIVAGTAPYTGSFDPEQPLAGLVGQTITGTWSSGLTDDAGSDTGSWTELSLALCADPP